MGKVAGVAPSHPIFNPDLDIELRKKMHVFLDKGNSVYEYERDLLRNYWGFLRGVIQGRIMPPIYGEIDPIDQCNLKCKRCFFRKVLGSGNSLSREIIFKAVDEMHAYGVQKVWFSGFGEPLMNPHTIEGMRRAINYGIKIVLYTNAILLTEETQVVVLNADFLKIDVDAAREESFEALKNAKGNVLTNVILRNVKEFVARKQTTGSTVKINASFLLQPENYQEMEEFVALMQEIGVDSVQFKFPVGDDQELDQEQISEIFREYIQLQATFETGGFKIIMVETEEQLKQDAPTNVRDIAFQEYATAWVRPDGMLYPQSYSSFNPIAAIGDIRKESLKDIWEGENRRRVLAGTRPEENEYVRYDLLIDPFFTWLQDQYKEFDEKFIEWVELNYVLPLRANMQGPIIITGASGSVGRGLFRRMDDSGVNVYGTWFSNKPAGDIEQKWRQLDIRNREAVLRLFEEVQPKTLIHCVSLLTAESERNQQLGTEINVDGTKNIAEACKHFGTKLVFISTNHVFDGEKKSPYTENDRPNPVNHYGRTKLEAENAVRSIMEEEGNWIIVRIPYVVGYDQKYPMQLLGMLAAGKSITLPEDTITTPTHIDGVTEVLLRLIGGDRRGLYHIASDEPISRLEATQRLAAAADVDITLIQTTTFKQMVSETGVNRPRYSGLTSVHGQLTASPRLNLSILDISCVRINLT